MDFKIGDKIQFKGAGEIYTIEEIKHSITGSCGKFKGYKDWYSLQAYTLMEREIQKPECTCSTRQIFDFGCRCGFLKPYELEW